MHNLDPLTSALTTLCNREGIEFVAATAEVSAENLRQILKGTKLPSGEPRRVGPRLRGKLSKAYPHWLNPVVTPFRDTGAGERSTGELLKDAIQALAAILESMPKSKRTVVSSALTLLADNPNDVDTPTALISALIAGAKDSARETPMEPRAARVM